MRDAGIWDWDLAADTVFFSERWKAMLGFGDEEIGDRLEEWLARVHTEDLPELSARLRAYLDGESEHFECEYRIANGRSGQRWMLCWGLAVRAASGRPMRVVGSQTDITERKQAG